MGKTIIYSACGMYEMEPRELTCSENEFNELKALGCETEQEIAFVEDFGIYVYNRVHVNTIVPRGTAAHKCIAHLSEPIDLEIPELK